MNNYFVTVKLLLRNMFRGDRSDKKAARRLIVAAVALSILYAIVVATIVGIIFVMSSAFVAYELRSELISMIFTADFMFVLIFGIATTLTQLYFSRDTEFFLGLPIKPSTVFLAKLTVVYLVELFVSALLLLPCLITAGVCIGAPAVFYIVMPFAILLSPAIPLLFASIISIPIMYIVSFMKNRGALGSIIVLILFGAFFAVYYMGIMKLQQFDPENIDLSIVQGTLRKIASVIYPLYALSHVMTLEPSFGLGVGASAAANIGIYIGCVAAFAIVAVLISSAVYRRGAAGQLESAKRKKNFVGDYRSSGIVKALMKREWRELIRTPSFALNCLLGVVVSPIIVGLMSSYLKMSIPAEEDFVAGGFMHIMRTMTLWFVIFFSTGMNAGASTTFSREGENMALAKMLPIDYKTQVRAKSYLYLAIGCLSAILGIIVIAIVNFDLTFFICSIVFSIVINFGAVYISMLFDIRNPKLKWTTPNEAIKHNRNYVFAMLTNLGVSLVVVLIGGVLDIALLAGGHPILGEVLCWVFMFIAAGTYTAIGYGFLYSGCDTRYENIQI